MNPMSCVGVNSMMDVASAITDGRGRGPQSGRPLGARGVYGSK